MPPAELEAMYGRERPGKSRDRLQAAVLRKQDDILENMAGTMGRGVGTIHRWLSRMEREGPEGSRNVIRRLPRAFLPVQVHPQASGRAVNFDFLDKAHAW